MPLQIHGPPELKEPEKRPQWSTAGLQWPKVQVCHPTGHPWHSQQATAHAGVAEMLWMSSVLLVEPQQRFFKGTAERHNSAKKR